MILTIIILLLFAIASYALAGIILSLLAGILYMYADWSPPIVVGAATLCTVTLVYYTFKEAGKWWQG